jgi:hypothetical protein
MVLDVPGPNSKETPICLTVTVRSPYVGLPTQLSPVLPGPNRGSPPD